MLQGLRNMVNANNHTYYQKYTFLINIPFDYIYIYALLKKSGFCNIAFRPRSYICHVLIAAVNE